MSLYSKDTQKKIKVYVHRKITIFYTDFQSTNWGDTTWGWKQESNQEWFQPFSALSKVPSLDNGF